MQLNAAEIGGARVLRPLLMGDGFVPVGTVLSGDEARAIPVANLRALVENRFLSVWPSVPPSGGTPAAERFLVPRSGGKFDVVEGRRVNDAPLSGEEARALVRDRA